MHGIFTLTMDPENTIKPDGSRVCIFFGSLDRLEMMMMMMMMG